MDTRGQHQKVHETVGKKLSDVPYSGLSVGACSLELVQQQRPDFSVVIVVNYNDRPIPCDDTLMMLRHLRNQMAWRNLSRSEHSSSPRFQV